MIIQREVSKRVFDARIMSFVLLILPLLVAGCTGATPTATDPTPVSAATEVASTVSDEQLAMAATVGDISAGEELFNKRFAEVGHSLSCSSCHTLDGNDSRDAPSLAGISAVAADRVDEMPDIDYLRQSIVDPNAFRVTGEWASPMPNKYSDVLSEDEIDNLIAFLLTR
jgi:mono/diheme cytochrome c family protein